MASALAPSTRSSYSTGWACYVTFCLQSRINPTPFNQDWIMAFIVHAKDSLHLAPATIRLYLSGIQHQFRLMSINSPTLLSIPAVRLLLRGISKCSPAPSSARLPISIDILSKLISILRHGCFSPFDDLTMEVICLSAFFGFLRCSEYTVPSIASFPTLGIRCSDLKLIPDSHFILFLRISKTDQLRQGQCIQLSKINSPLCPFTSMLKYIAERKAISSSDPLFINSSRSIVSRHWFSTHLSTVVSRAGLPSQFYTPHSFRIGAATSAAKANINQHLIKNMGRWTSSAVESYIRSSSSEISSAHQSIASMSGVGTTFLPEPPKISP